jgi:hypothetical protein
MSTLQRRRKKGEIKNKENDRAENDELKVWAPAKWKDQGCQRQQK